ncbi:hypothetical protein Gotur_025073, partial [Gossypium turneri]
MHSPYSLGPPPNRRLVRCNPITPLFPSVSITDISCNSHFEFEVGNRDSPSIPNFIFLFLPSSSPDISQFFPFQISTSSSGTVRFFSSHISFLFSRFLLLLPNFFPYFSFLFFFVKSILILFCFCFCLCSNLEYLFSVMFS